VGRSPGPAPDLPPRPARPELPPWASSRVMTPCEPTGPLRRAPRSAISLFLDIGQGAGLAGATGVRPFLPPLLAGALAGGNIGVNFDRGAFAFLESPTFLLVVLVLAVVAYAAERARVGRPLEVGLAVVGVLLGALLFAGVLANAGEEGWPGLIAGAACAALGFAAVARLLVRARRRVDPSAAALFTLYGDLAALALAAVSIFVPPVGLVALVAFAVLAVRSRVGGDRKYEGLRILR
jgi:hypothetical protein